MYGVQCKKRLYFHKYGKRLGVIRDELSAQQEAIFSTGTNVGELAQRLFPNGIDCTPESYYDFGPSIELTRKSIEEGKPVIYEAAFQYDQVLVALDILVEKEDGWHGYEVKSTNETKDTHIRDAALQYWVISNSELGLKSINVLHFNRDYVLGKELDIHQLFTWDDITEQVLLLQPWIEEQITANKACLDSDELPEIEIGSHCSDPYPCDFMGHCWKHVPNYSVFNLTRGGSKAWQLYGEGILDIKDIPDDFQLSFSQELQVSSEKSGSWYVDQEAITQFVDSLNYPLYFLDFETIMPAIPVFEGTRPYQQVVFQYSLHIQQSKLSSVDHKEHLANPNDAELRKNAMLQLIDDCGKDGDVLVYNKAFEASRINELISAFPRYGSRLQNIVDRMVDLAVPFQKKWFYTPEMRGSYSIKKVLPALVPELSYSDLEIQEGGTASLTFLQMVQGQFVGNENQVRQALLDYCKLDTFAMVKILNRLKSI